MRRASLFLLTLLVAACQPVQPKLTGSGMAMFAPVKVRIHPFSRVLLSVPTTTAPATAPSQSASLEALVEFTDQFGDPTKGVGDVTIQLFDTTTGLGGGRKGTLLGSWNISLSTPESNRDHWDRTSRTYFLKFPLPRDLPGERDHFIIVATLALPNNATLSDEASVQVK